LPGALAAHEQRRFVQAAADYRLVLEKRPDLTQARLNLAAALGELGPLDDAIAVLEAAPARDRAKPEVQKNLALAYYRKGDLTAAARELEILNAARPGDVPVTSMLADCYLRLRTPAKALAVLEPAARRNPNSADLNYQLGMALIRTGRAKEGLDPLEKSGRLANNADAYLLAGATALDVAQFQRARDNLEQAVRLNPKIPGAWTWTGMARDRVSDEDGAKEAFRRALDQNPSDFEANLHLGAILYRERELEGARPYLERALAIQPSSSLAVYALALVRSALGETDEAVKALEAVVQAAPDWVEPHVKLASLYFRLHRQAEGQRQQELVEKLRSERRGQSVPLPELENVKR
jgi:tetratricopeptide (TPR) repeat protein